MNHRLTRMAAAAGVLTLSAIALGSPGFAHDPGKAHDKNRIEKVIVISNHGDGDHARRHVRTLHIDGASHMADCGSDTTELSNSSEDGNERTRLILCSKGDLTAAQRREKLEQALERINSNEELSDRHKEKVTAALREAIERLSDTP